MPTTPFRVLLIGKVFVVPENGGTENFNKVTNVDAKVDDDRSIAELAKDLSINLVVSGLDQLVLDGIEVYFCAAQMPCSVQSHEAAQMEGSKAFAKAFMLRHSIPTARYPSLNDFESAVCYINDVSFDVVIKASGLAAGKGLILPKSKSEAISAVKEMILDRKFGDSGSEVVIEELLDGEELSILTFSDGSNTGGMGCYAAGKIATPALPENIDEMILRPTVHGLHQGGISFMDLLFTSLMITRTGPKALEYNARFGDPETYTLLPLLGSETDRAEIMLAYIEKRLISIHLHMVTDKGRVAVVVVSGGYPDDDRKGLPIPMDETNNMYCPKATSAGISTIYFENVFLRKDIGLK